MLKAFSYLKQSSRLKRTDSQDQPCFAEGKADSSSLCCIKNGNQGSFIPKSQKAVTEPEPKQKSYTEAKIYPVENSDAENQEC